MEQNLRKAVKERELDWKNKGIAFTFDKVDEWLTKTQYQNQRVIYNTDGSKEIESIQQKQIERKRTYNNAKGHMNESDTTESFSSPSKYDNSMVSSVDTAQYIRANQKYRTSKITKTIIKKYIVTSETNHSNNRSYKKICEKPRHKAIKYLDKRSSKRKHRKTRHELDKLHKSISVQSDSDSDFDMPLRQLPEKQQSTLRKVHSTPARIQRKASPTTLKPVVLLEKLSNGKLTTLGLFNGSPIKQNQKDIPKTPTQNNRTPSNEINFNTTNQNDTFNSLRGCSSRMSIMSGFTNVLSTSRLSWANLPKKAIIYTPDGNSSKQEKIKITNAHFEKALGTDQAKEFLQNYNYSKEIDAKSQLILERPSTDDDEENYNSDIDVLDFFVSKRPKLSIVPISD